MSDAKQWRDLYHLAAIERDPAKLELLFDEIKRLLDQCGDEDDSGNGRSKYPLPSRLQN